MLETADMTGYIYKVSGPLVIAKGLKGVEVYELIRVGTLGLIGEIVEINNDLVSIQVYEDTDGLRPGEIVKPTGAPLSISLAPGLVSSIYDGIGRPLDLIQKKSGYLIERGVSAESIDTSRLWSFSPLVSIGDNIKGGDIIGEVVENEVFVHKIMLPYNINGRVTNISKGEFTVLDQILELDGNIKVSMLQKWPVRNPRVYEKKLSPKELFITGQRAIDSFFPLAQGGTACIPGPFGSGKTVVQHQLAKWSEVDIVIYVGCGERGNEMTDVLNEFPKLKDPKTGQALIKRTVLIANTSNMPVAAREASVYTGITIAEYFRDMGYNVALMADSTSRWAEALREMSGRLEEMPGEEGYPAYLATRIAEFYERAGRVINLGGSEGTLTIIGAVSPPGGDLSDPVVQATLRVVKVFWSLDSKLAFSRHFPAIHWLRSYSLYIDKLLDYFTKNNMGNFISNRFRAMNILENEGAIQEIVRLVGYESLEIKDKITLRIAQIIREDFLHQDAFEDIDSYTMIDIQHLALEAILKLHDFMQEGSNKADIVEHPIQKEFSKINTRTKDEIQDLIKKSFIKDGGLH